MAVLLLRHAEAGDRSRWQGPDETRPLTAEGLAQADGLVRSLGGFAVARIWSSPYTRCTQTVAPLAAARGLAVEPCNDVAEGAGWAAVTLVRELSQLSESPDVVLCTHGDVMEEVLDALGIRRSEETEKGATWILDRGEARYLPPPD